MNLFILASIFVMFGAAELVALLLSEIDLSVGFVAACGAFIIAEVNQPPVNLPWWVGVIAGVGFCALFGSVQGTLITRLGLPSFVVTLGGFLAAEGIMLELATVDKTALGGVITINGASPVYKLAGAEMSPTLSWIVLAAALAAYAAFSLGRAQRRRKAGLCGPADRRDVADDRAVRDRRRRARRDLQREHARPACLGSCPSSWWYWPSSRSC